jgi:hypothetical protein
MLKFRLIVLSALACSVCLHAAPKTTTLEGQLVSSTCYLADHSNTGNAMGGAEKCGEGCLRQGKPGGLVTKDNQFYILDGPSLALAPFVGQQIRVTGEERTKDIISVSTAQVKKAGGWETIDTKYHDDQRK